VFAEGGAEVDNVTVNGNGTGTGNGTAEPVNNSGAKGSSLDKLLYRINPEIENVAISRHKSGLMSPYICQILKNVCNFHFSRFNDFIFLTKIVQVVFKFVL